ncbi:MAG: hypothetical protein R2853_06975 [Thermomicrobiales bacterium]
MSTTRKSALSYHPQPEVAHVARATSQGAGPGGKTMNMAIDKLATAVATRRASLALGSAALLGLAHAPVADAKKNKKKSCKKKSRQKVDQACGAQVDQCEAFYATICSGTPDPAQCQATVATCCAPMADCDFAGAANCFSALV